MALSVSSAFATYKVEKFPGCDCDSPVTLVGFDFENVSVGTMGNSVPASEVFDGFTATNIQGPDKVLIGEIAGSNWGCFGGFSSHGYEDEIKFDLTNNSGEDYCLNNITFDYVTESSGYKHGPTTFRVVIYDGATGSIEFKTFKTEVTPGTSNGGSFSLAEMTGYNYTYTDEFVTMADGDSKTISISAWGANKSSIGFDIDNLKVMACGPDVVPEPSTSLLAAIGVSFILIRRKR